MTEVTQSDRDAAEAWVLQAPPEFRSTVDHLAKYLARHREQAVAEERAKIVAYLVKGRAGIIAASIEAKEHLK